MNYCKLKNFELHQFIRILGNDYQDIKYSLEMLERGVLTLKISDFIILKKYEKFKKVLEKELRNILKEVGEERIQDFLYLFPYETFKKKRGRKKCIKISKKYKN